MSPNVLQTFQPKNTLNCSGRILDLSNPLVMGILNITPDSFFPGSRHHYVDDVLHKAELMLKQGAAILDIGGQSTRPGSAQISAEDEWARLELIVPELVRAFPNAFFSIDTYYSFVAEKAFNAGFHIVNDVSAFDDDPNMLTFLKHSRMPYIMMHKKGKIENMQSNPVYENVVLEIIDYFKTKISVLNENGIYDVVIDPGFGFGKTFDHNLQILKSLKSFRIFNLPLLIGLSRKKTLRDIADVSVEDALNITTAANMVALMNSARILRVHDVKEAVETIKFYNAISNA